MQQRKCLALVFGFIAAFSLAEANAGDRFFQINVKLISGGTAGDIFGTPIFDPPMPAGPNCYSFLEDGTWIDPLFPNPIGTWTGDSSGGLSSYTASASFLGIFLLIQEGTVTSNAGNGQAHLHAVSTLYVFGEEVAQYMSNGREVGGC